MLTQTVLSAQHQVSQIAIGCCQAIAALHLEQDVTIEVSVSTGLVHINYVSPNGFSQEEEEKIEAALRPLFLGIEVILSPVHSVKWSRAT